jgi:hypothetical protein
VATFIAVYANWSFARIKGMGWGWAGVIWVYSIVTYIPLDILKFVIRYVLSGKAWDNLLENKVIAPSFLPPLPLSQYNPDYNTSFSTTCNKYYDENIN